MTNYEKMKKLGPAQIAAVIVKEPWGYWFCDHVCTDECIETNECPKRGCKYSDQDTIEMWLNSEAEDDAMGRT